MGQAILYCATCQIQVKQADIDRGAGFRLENLTYCKKCAREAVKSLPPDKVDAILAHLAKESMSDAAEAPVRGPATERRTSRRPTDPPARKAFPVVLGTAVVLLVTGALILLLLPGSKPPPPEPAPVVGVTRPPPPRPPPVPEPAPLPAPRDNEAEALRQRLREEAARDFAQVREGVRGAFAGGDFPRALTLVQEARTRHPELEHAAELNALAADVAREAQAKGDAAGVRTLRDQVVAWRFPTLVEEFDRALETKAPPPPPPPPPAPPEVSPALKAWTALRTEAVSLALGHEYAAAAERLAKALPSLSDESFWKQAADDAEHLRRMDLLHRAVVAALAKWPKDQKLDLEFLADDGKARRASGLVVRSDPHRLWIKEAEQTTEVLAGEILARSIAELAIHRSGKTPEDERTAALLCLFEGDVEAGRRIWGSRDAAALAAYVTLPRPKLDPRDAEARALFYRAEADRAHPATEVAAARAAELLLREFAETAFVRRLRPAVAERAKGGHEYFLEAAVLAAAGTFAASTSEKAGACWTSSAASDAAVRKQNYVEAAFSVRADTEYRCWAYVGGCCAEALSFGLQGTDLQGTDPKTREPLRAEPGSDSALPLRASLTTTYRTHAAHEGRKVAARWGWVPLALPKAPADGERKLRLLTDQEGFSVACVLVSSTRTSPPGETELKKLLDPASRPAAAATRSGVRILCYRWTGLSGAARDADVLQTLSRRDPRIRVDVVNDSLAGVNFANYDVIWLSWRSVCHRSSKAPTGPPENPELLARAADLKKFAEAGGLVWVSGQDDDAYGGGDWIPAPVRMTGGKNEPVTVLPGAGQELFSTPHRIESPSLLEFDDFWRDWDPRVQPLAVRETAPGVGALLLLKHGRGHYLLTAVVTTSPKRDEVNSKLFENALSMFFKARLRPK